jgi:hypothetical protein
MLLTMRDGQPSGGNEQGDHRPDQDDPTPHNSGPSARTLLIAALIMVALGYFLSVKLREMSRIQDCAMSGRTNCAPISGEK